MKKLFKVILYIFLSLLVLLACLIIFLDIYYSVIEKKFEKKNMEIEARTITPPFSTGKTIEKNIPETLNLLPVPKKAIFSQGHLSIGSSIHFSSADSIKDIVSSYLKMIPGVNPEFVTNGGNVKFMFNKDVARQGYYMDVKNDRITISYSDLQGLYYAVISMKVLNNNYSGSIPCVYIEDSPDLEVRGLMLDISRNKVPSKETLLNIAQLLADLKYNHLELYVEGFSFAYPSFRKLWEDTETPVSIDEIRELDLFCKEHYIDLVANQNSLGHMTAWLATDQYKDLAECPNGYKMLGLISMKSTLNPGDPGSLELVSRMTDDILPAFSSPNFNINLDEPFELGKGKSKELCKEKGEGTVYLDYALKLHDMLTGKNKKVLMWADIVLRHPELLPRIPKDITLLDWGYEASYPYARHCRTLQSTGLNYMVCPGTNSWTTITGRTDNMLATIDSATTNGVKYGAKGMLLTDWGDMGHWQYLPVSYAGYATGAAMSWNCKNFNEARLSRFLSSYVFKDMNYVMGDLVLDLGRYYRYEAFPMLNMTTTMMSLEFGLRDRLLIDAIVTKSLGGIKNLMGDLAPETVEVLVNNYDNRHRPDYEGLQKFLDDSQELLKNARPGTPDSVLIRDEYLNAMRLIRIGSCLQNYINQRGIVTIAQEKVELKKLKELGTRYLEENNRLWLLRNKPGGYNTSVASLNALMKQFDDRLIMLNKNSVARAWNRFLEKIVTSAAVLYLGSASS
jgi:hexosaminidase